MAAINEAESRSAPRTSDASSRFYVTGGTVPTDASSYVTRQADADLIDRLRTGDFCYVLNSRQMGKSSLMVRTAIQLKAEGVAVAVIDLTAIGQNLTAEQWYEGMLLIVGEQLHIEDEIEDFLADNRLLGPLQRFMNAIRQVVLPLMGAKPVVLFVDEIDAVRSLSFSTDEFFAATRECYNRRTSDPEMRRLTFCLLGVATPADLIRDVRTTPFNIGRRVELTDFTAREAAQLARGMTSPGRDGRLLLRRVLYWTSGHPYLTQRLCQAIATEKNIRRSFQVDRLCRALFLSKKAQETDDNLAFVRNRMLQSEVDLLELLDLYTRILRRLPLPVNQREEIRNDDSNPAVAVLLLAGVVRVTATSRGLLRIRNRIYRTVFDQEWADNAVPDSGLRRQRAAVARARLQVGSIASFIVLIIAMLAIMLYRETTKARAITLESNRLLYIADMNLAQQAWDKDNVPRVSELLQSVSGNPDRGFEWNYLRRLCHLERWATSAPLVVDSAAHAASQAGPAQNAPGRELAATSLAFAPDERMLCSGSANGIVSIGNDKGSSIFPTVGLSSANLLQYSPDGRRLFVDGQLYDVVTKRRLRPAPPNFSAGAMACASDMTRFACGSATSDVTVWDAITGKAIRAITPGKGAGNVLALSKNGRLLAAGADNAPIRILAVTGAHIPITVFATAPSIAYIAFAGPSDRLLAASNGDGLPGSQIDVWDSATGRRQLSFRVVGNLFAVSPDGNLLATATNRGSVILWSLKDGARQLLIRGNITYINALCFSGDSRLIATATSDGITKVWDAHDSNVTQVISAAELGHDPETSAIRKAPNSPDANTTDQSMFVRCGLEPFVYRSCTPDDYDYGQDHGLELPKIGCRMQQADLKFPLAFQHSAELSELKGIICVDFSPDGSRIVTGTRTGAVTIWNASTGTAELALDGHSERIISATYSPDGKRIVTSSQDGTIRLWESKTGQQIYSYDAEPGQGERAALFSADGSALILAKIGSEDKNGSTTVYSCKPVTRAVLVAETRQAIRAYNLRHLASADAVQEQ